LPPLLLLPPPPPALVLLALPPPLLPWTPPPTLLDFAEADVVTGETTTIILTKVRRRNMTLGLGSVKEKETEPENNSTWMLPPPLLGALTRMTTMTVRMATAVSCILT
jgi:hypothetical protein